VIVFLLGSVDAVIPRALLHRVSTRAAIPPLKIIFALYLHLLVSHSLNSGGVLEDPDLTRIVPETNTREKSQYSYRSKFEKVAAIV
jgi:hypothetical protein